MNHDDDKIVTINVAQRDLLIRRKAEACAALEVRVKGLNAERKAIFDEIEANGITRKAFQHSIKVAKMDEEKRNKYLADCAVIANAFGWAHEQLELLPVVATADFDDDQAAVIKAFEADGDTLDSQGVTRMVAAH